MSRGHVHGFDSNAAQFERMGNPWVGEPVLKTRAKKARRKAGVRPCRSGLPRLGERESRVADDVFAETNFWLGFNQRKVARNGGSRTVAADTDAPQETIAPWTREIAPAARAELSRWSRFERMVRKAEQQRDFNAKRAAAEAAYLASEAYRREERRKLESIIAAAQARLAGL